MTRYQFYDWAKLRPWRLRLYWWWFEPWTQPALAFMAASVCLGLVLQFAPRAEATQPRCTCACAQDASAK